MHDSSELPARRRPPYKGTSTKLVVSIDVGTTFTAASFCVLQPGNIPKFREVLRWPKQAVPEAKVPSVLYYDGANKACAFGAETEDDNTIMEAEESGWRKTEWFKLHLRPPHLPIIKNLKLPALPKNVTVDDIFADHFRYVTEQVKNVISSSYGGGAEMWEMLSPQMFVILTTPNGWEGLQQHRLRQAAVKAGIVDAAGGQRVKFVTEAEAAVLYAIDTGSVDGWLVQYSKRNMPLDLLKGYRWGNKDAIDKLMISFEHAKRKFDGPDTTSWIQVDGIESVTGLNIVRGKLKISGEIMASFYEHSLTCIKEGLGIAFENGLKMADVSTCKLGGRENGIAVCRPDGPTTKAVANGALAWHVDNTVSSRYAKDYYGIEIEIPFNAENEEHAGQPAYMSTDGVLSVQHVWNGIVDKNVKIKTCKEFMKEYCEDVPIPTQLPFVYSVPIFVYRKANKPRTFTTSIGKGYQPGFEVICTVRGDLSQCLLQAPARVSPTGSHYRTIHVVPNVRFVG
ncbi:hypothetical protein HWV62_20280 [Athelia sp. TMB]|nr:hypothetical protein HWV62_20280 [Athelia sp. TMB]